MKQALFISSMLLSTASFAGLPEMMKIYNNPSLSPNTEYCAVTDNNCKAFTALSKHWQSIPNSYRYQGTWDIKKYAAKGDAYGLHKGFYLYRDKSINLVDSADVYFDFASKKKSAIYAKGTAVIMYIEDKNGWAKD